MPDEERLHLLDQAFSPFAPILLRDLFHGRYEHLERTCNAIRERGQHIVIYGERGVGKTSLANILNTLLQNVVVSKVTCNRNESFKEIWNKALAQVRFFKAKDGIGFRPEKAVEATQLNLFLPDKEYIEPLDVQNVLEGVNHHLLFVFDEFDSITNSQVRAHFADTIKSLSDNAPHVTVAIVGIAENVEDLIGAHPSLERCLAQMHLPRMSNDELGRILIEGSRYVDLDFKDNVFRAIVSLSTGFPHFAHLLGKFSCRSALEADEEIVTPEHYNEALKVSLRNTSESVRVAYQKATIASKRESRFPDVVSACALAETDEFGTFSTRDLIEPYYQVTGERVRTANLAYNVQRLTTEDKGRLLASVGKSRNIRYRFSNPLIKVYVRMRLEQEGTFAQPSLFEK